MIVKSYRAVDHRRLYIYSLVYIPYQLATEGSNDVERNRKSAETMNRGEEKSVSVRSAERIISCDILAGDVR
jgi:hypothetical protein